MNPRQLSAGHAANQQQAAQSTAPATAFEAVALDLVNQFDRATTIEERVSGLLIKLRGQVPTPVSDPNTKPMDVGSPPLINRMRGSVDGLRVVTQRTQEMLSELEQLI